MEPPHHHGTPGPSRTRDNEVARFGMPCSLRSGPLPTALHLDGFPLTPGGPEASPCPAAPPPCPPARGEGSPQLDCPGKSQGLSTRRTFTCWQETPNHQAKGLEPRLCGYCSPSQGADRAGTRTRTHFQRTDPHLIH